MKRATPYDSMPSYAFWRRSVASVPPGDLDPIVRAPYRLTPHDKIATAGSCFAQHISRYLAQHDCDYFVTEKAHPLVAPEAAGKYNYGTFSARFGNLYTSRQLLQLIKRAYGEFKPQDDIWESAGRFIDPFRPQIQPGGFSSREEFYADREQHFAKVRQMFEEADVFVFTLGLTECWHSTVDGAVYPLCPGVAGGEFDPSIHRFVNLTAAEVESEMKEAIDSIRSRNPKIKVLLTVSPVPLIATAEDRHVLVSTVYSKSVLRVAAEGVCKTLSEVAYLPSYEIITSQASRGGYFADDLRSVGENGVAHVMTLVFKHYFGMDIGQKPNREGTSIKRMLEPTVDTEMVRLVEVNCEEEALDRH